MNNIQNHRGYHMRKFESRVIKKLLSILLAILIVIYIYNTNL